MQLTKEQLGERMAFASSKLPLGQRKKLVYLRRKYYELKLGELSEEEFRRLISSQEVD